MPVDLFKTPEVLVVLIKIKLFAINGVNYTVSPCDDFSLRFSLWESTSSRLTCWEFLLT